MAFTARRCYIKPTLFINMSLIGFRADYTTQPFLSKDTPNLKMANDGSLSYIINHVFLPSKLPQEDDSEYQKDFALGKQCEMDAVPAAEYQEWHEKEISLSSSDDGGCLSDSDHQCQASKFSKIKCIDYASAISQRPFGRSSDLRTACIGRFEY